MNTSPERKRVREEIGDYLLRLWYKTDVWAEAPDNAHKWEYFADQILSIKGILIEADDQTLPPNEYAVSFPDKNLLFDTFRDGQVSVWNAGFRKVVKE